LQSIALHAHRLAGPQCLLRLAFPEVGHRLSLLRQGICSRRSGLPVLRCISSAAPSDRDEIQSESGGRSKRRVQLRASMFASSATFLNAFALDSHSIRANGTGKRKSECRRRQPRCVMGRTFIGAQLR
jgi:hypothetical protein